MFFHLINIIYYYYTTTLRGPLQGCFSNNNPQTFKTLEITLLLHYNEESNGSFLKSKIQLLFIFSSYIENGEKKLFFDYITGELVSTDRSQT